MGSWVEKEMRKNGINVYENNRREGLKQNELGCSDLKNLNKKRMA